MIQQRHPERLASLVRELVNLPAETEWLEFKRNNERPEDIGEYISALSNSAALFNNCAVRNFTNFLGFRIYLLTTGTLLRKR